MKRDLNLIRKLVLAVEDRPSDATSDEGALDGYTSEQIGYHNYLLVDAGLAKGVDATTISDVLPQWHIFHLASAEHDFVDAARSESTWTKEPLA